MIELRLKLGQLQRGGLQSSRFQLQREGFSLERVLPREGFASRGFCLERVLPREDFASRGFCPREGFALRGFCPREDSFPREDFGRERVFPEQIQNLTCRFLVVNQVHYKDPSMVLDGERELLQATGRD